MKETTWKMARRISKLTGVLNYAVKNYLFDLT